MNAIRVAVWGLGSHAIKNILPALRECPGIALYGVCSRNAETVARISEEFACAGWTSPTEMLRDPDLDVVYLSTPIALHASQGHAVVSAAKHLWCEKPLADSAAQATVLASLSRAHDVTLCEGLMYLYHPHFVYLQDVVRSGRLGQLHSVTCRFGIPPLDRPGFRLYPELGGGAFLDVGSYPISGVTALFPDTEAKVLFAEILVAPGSSADTAGRAFLRFGETIDATLEWRINSAYRNEIDLWGSEGSVSSERIFSKPADHLPRFRFLDRQGRHSDEFGTAENHFLAMFRSFRRLIDDPAGAERERGMIERRARLFDQIRQQSRT